MRDVEGLGLVEVAGDVVHHGEEGVVQVLGVAPEGLQQVAVVAHHVHGGKPAAHGIVSSHAL